MAQRREHRLPQRDRAPPGKHLTVIVLTNRNDPEPYPLAQKIAQRWLDTLQ